MRLKAAALQQSVQAFCTIYLPQNYIQNQKREELPSSFITITNKSRTFFALLTLDDFIIFLSRSRSEEVDRFTCLALLQFSRRKLLTLISLYAFVSNQKSSHFRVQLSIFSEMTQLICIGYHTTKSHSIEISGHEKPFYFNKRSFFPHTNFVINSIFLNSVSVHLYLVFGIRGSLFLLQLTYTARLKINKSDGYGTRL